MNNFKEIINVNRNDYNQLASEFNSRESDLADYKQNLKGYISRFVKESESVLEILFSILLCTMRVKRYSLILENIKM